MENNEVKPLGNGSKKTMSSLEIAELTGKRHKDVLEAIRKMEPAWSAVTGRIFPLSEYKDRSGRKLPCYYLNQRECLFIATKFNDTARAKLVVRWETLETAASESKNNVFIMPSDFSDALRQLADQVERNERLALENKQQSEKIRQDAPKVTYFEAFMQAAHGSKSVGIREVVKQAHIKSEKKFIIWMIDKRILFRQKRDNRLQPYAEYTSCFDSVEFHDDANDYSGKQLLMNPLGKMRIVKRYHDEQPLEFDSPRNLFSCSSLIK